VTLSEFPETLAPACPDWTNGKDFPLTLHGLQGVGRGGGAATAYRADACRIAPTAKTTLLGLTPWREAIAGIAVQIELPAPLFWRRGLRFKVIRSLKGARDFRSFLSPADDQRLRFQT